jgi:uncharacterized phage protein (TIGR02220 family)
MSIIAIGSAWKHMQTIPKEKLSTTDRMILLALCNCANEENDYLCIPSSGYISRLTGISKDRIKRGFTKLKNLNLIRVHHRYRKDGSLTSNSFDVTPIINTSTPSGSGTPPLVVQEHHLVVQEHCIKQEVKQEDNKQLVEKRILSHLNKKTGKTFRAVNGNLDKIKARLASGITEKEIIGVIDMKYDEWHLDRVMSKYLRPETLFGATKFESYYADLNESSTSTLSGENFIPI